MTLHVRTIEDLKSLPKRSHRGRGRDRLALDIEGLAEADAKEWEGRLSRYYFACGCEAGSVALLLAVSAYVVAIGLQSGGFAAATGHDAVVGVVVGFVAAGVGKAAGLIHARRRLLISIRSLMSALDHIDGER